MDSQPDFEQMYYTLSVQSRTPPHCSSRATPFAHTSLWLTRSGQQKRCILLRMRTFKRVYCGGKGKKRNRSMGTVSMSALSAQGIALSADSAFLFCFG